MRKVCFSLFPHQVDEVFSPLRSKMAAARLLMRTIKNISTNDKLDAPPRDIAVPYFMFCVSKMKRIVYVSEKKILSIAFPYNLLPDMTVESSQGIQLDNAMTSRVLSLLNTLENSEGDSAYDFACRFDEDRDFHSPDNVWYVFRDLMAFDYGYLRCDEDAERANGNIHPLNHVDVFLHNAATIKLGLDNRMDHQEFLNVLDLGSDCYFLNKRAD